jgi:hypothetical protein
VAFANEYIAVSHQGNSFKMTAPVPGVITVYDYNQSSGPILSDKKIGPGIILTGNFSTGVRVVSDDKEICNIKLPLEYVDNSSEHAKVEAWAARNGCYEDAGSSPLDARWEYGIELEEIATERWTMSHLAALVGVNDMSSGDDADIIISRANAAYRSGGFDIVEQYLAKLDGRNAPQANYLEGLMALEKGENADFSNTVIQGNYFKALQSIKDGNTGAAVSALDELLEEHPDAVRPRLLRAYLNRSINDAMYIYRIVPGSLELWVVLKELGYPGAAENLDGLLEQQDIASIRADDFRKEISDGVWRHERRFEYNSGWFSNVSLPAFPDFLRY